MRKEHIFINSVEPLHDDDRVVTQSKPLRQLKYFSPRAFDFVKLSMFGKGVLRRLRGMRISQEQAEKVRVQLWMLRLTGGKVYINIIT